MPAKLKMVAVGGMIFGLVSCTGPTSPSAADSLPEVGEARYPDPALPGCEADRTLTEGLAVALAEKGPAYEPRTRHRLPEGQPAYINRLILESSPYLVQHAHSPVNFYPWGKEAFERAKKENKPVLLSVGYATCHWCHVMERESFEDEEIATFLNKNFISIKVDREERPDVDEIYMAAVHALTGRGGWPMTVVMTPDRQPFFAGTYFPARDGDRGSRKGFLTILRELDERYRTQPSEVANQARDITAEIVRRSAPQPPAGIPGPEVLRATAERYARSFDPKWGGFGKKPKFPRPGTGAFLLRYHRRTGDEQARHVAVHTLRQMAAGGIYDHVGGGFHRYSVDAQWLVPHFEKMLYDNTQLALLYLEAWQLTADPSFERVARETLDYLSQEMASSQGLFYAATDADSPAPGGEDEEGRFFTWTQEEIYAVVDPPQADWFCSAYGVTPSGNFEGRTILNRPGPLADVAKRYTLSSAQLDQGLMEVRGALFAARAKRPPPILDDLVLVGWNGLAISAFAKAGLVLDEDRYVRQAATAAEALREHLVTPQGRLYRSYHQGQAGHNGVLQDYAFLIQGLLDLYESSGELKWLDWASELQMTVDEAFLDPVDGGYFLTPLDGEVLLAQTKPDSDGAIPSGNSVTALNLLRLEEFTGDQAHRERAEGVFRALSARMRRGGTGAPNLLTALDFYLDAPREVVLVGPTQPDIAPLLDVVRTTYLPNRILVVAPGDAAARHRRLIPLLEGKEAIADRGTAFVCERGLCEQPTSDPAVLRTQLTRVKPLSDPPPAPLTVRQ